MGGCISIFSASVQPFQDIWLPSTHGQLVVDLHIMGYEELRSSARTAVTVHESISSYVEHIIGLGEVLAISWAALVLPAAALALVHGHQ